MKITDRIDAITSIPVAYLSPAPPAPKSVKIELTGRCNYRCGFCALRTREAQPKTDMEMPLFKRITTEMREAGVEEIGMFYLGESFMAAESLIEAIAWCKSLGFSYLFLTTNGSLATPALVRRCMEAGLDSLKFSVNAADAEQFESVMGVKGELFQQSLDNLQAARRVRDEGGYKCGIFASSIRYDGEQQAKMTLLANGCAYVGLFGCALFMGASHTAKRNWVIGLPPVIKVAWRRCASRCPVGAPLPKGM